MKPGAAGDDALEHVGQPCIGLTPLSFAVWISVIAIAQWRAPSAHTCGESAHTAN